MKKRKVEIERPLKRGLVAVGKYDYKTKKVMEVPSYTTIIIHVGLKNFGESLSPYYLKNEFGQILENVWQFSKLFAVVHEQHLKIGKKLIWEHGKEIHYDHELSKKQDKLVINEYYWNWRRKGMNNPYAVRWPNGFHGSKEILCSVITKEWSEHPESFRPEDIGKYPPIKLEYIQARKAIYCSEYQRLAPSNDEFKSIKQMIESGSNILICEVDGPPTDQMWRGYPFNLVTPCLVMTPEIVTKLLHYEGLSFGHGYVLAALLIGYVFLPEK